MIREKVLAEEEGATATEFRERITFVRARKAPRLISPSEEAPRDHADTWAFPKEPEHEVVVFRPTLVVVARIVECPFANHQRRMRHGAFDESV